MTWIDIESTPADARRERHEISRFLNGLIQPEDGVMWSARNDFECQPGLTLKEVSYLHRCVPKRRNEFLAGRDCALHALHVLGKEKRALGRMDDRRPTWPPGFIGSISHCEGLCLAIVAQTNRWRFIACDVEPNLPLPEDLQSFVLLPTERHAHSCSDLPDRLWYGVKESVFKALHGRVGSYFGFEAAEIRFDIKKGQFSSTLSPWLKTAARIGKLEGHFLVTPRFLVTVILAPPS
ncbi:MAG: hypothetical protein GY927_21885 [bacterium]|nr:hypothetical protein [bacterium]